MNLKQRNCFRPKKEKKNKTKAISVILVESSDSFSFIPKIIGVDFYLRIAAENNSNYNNKRILGIPAQESRWMKQMNLAFHFLGHYTTIIIIDTTQIWRKWSEPYRSFPCLTRYDDLLLKILQ